MADKEQFDLITEDGVTAWNAWRTENPRVLTDLSGADLQGRYLMAANFGGTNLRDAVLKGARLKDAHLTGANLSGADFSGADLTKAKLSGANLTGANLTNAILSGADLADANLRNTNLTGANFQNSHLNDANFRGATLEKAKFDQAQINHRTLGLGHLPLKTRASMIEVQVEAIPEDTPQEPTQQVPDNSDSLTVGYAKSIVGPAHEVLSGLPIPNDLSEAHRDLFLEFRRTVADIQRDLAGVTDQNKLMSGEIDALGKAQKALPVWRETWITFIAAAAGGAAGTAGASAASYAAGYTAGFIAGVLHDTFSPDSLCIIT